MPFRGDIDALDILGIMSFALGLENLKENREQSKQNDVNLANDKQAEYLIQALDGQMIEALKSLDEKFKAIQDHMVLQDGILLAISEKLGLKQ